MAPVVRVEIAENVALITIDHPPMNILNRTVTDALGDIFCALEQDSSVIAVVLTGAGDRAFAAGADVKSFPDALGKPGVAAELARGLHEIMNRIDNFAKPTIAALHGFVLGGGLELALSCDIRVCDVTTQLGLPEIKLGILPGAGGTQRLPRLIGEGRAKQMMFTGVPVDAATAERWGLVNLVTEPGQQLEAAMKLALLMARRSLQALSRIKRAVDRGRDLTLADAIEQEIALFDEVFQTEDSREGIRAFIDKREPRFQHR